MAGAAKGAARGNRGADGEAPASTRRVSSVPPVVERVLGDGGFTVERFVECFDVLVGAAGGTKRLRELVLRLATSGRLTEQLPADGSVDELIRKVEQRRQRLVQERRATKTDGEFKELPIPAPFAAPHGWKWVTFGMATICRDGQRIPVSKEERATRRGTYPYYGASGIIDGIDDFIYGQPLLLIGEDGANLLSRSTPIAFIATGKYWVNNHAHVLDGAGEDYLRYMALFINAIDLTPYVTGTAQPKMNQAKMNSIPVLIPPLAEQKRIVARVDQLMALIDELEAKQTRKREVGARFTQASLEALTNAEGPKEFDAAWKRVVENWETVLDGADRMTGVRDMVLDLAARGCLVAQDDREGTGGQLLQQIAKKRSHIKPGSTNASTIAHAELPCPHPIPNSWTWASLEVLTHPVRLIRYGILMPGPDRKDGPLYVKVKNMKGGVIDVASLNRTTPEIFAKFSGAALDRGDLLVSIRGSFGGVALVPDELAGANITQDSARIAPMTGVERRYLLLVLRSPLCQRFFGKVAKGAAVQGVNIGDLRRSPVPLPPVAEQQRIIAKVDLLMKLCDDLHDAMRSSESRASRLVEAVVQETVA